MKRLCIIILPVFFVMAHRVQAQSPTSRDPGKKVLVVSPSTKKVKKHRKNVRHTARYEFYERVEKAAREKQRLLRKLAKPAFSDRRYFGHRRIPKRNTPHNMRYCDECGIRH